MQHRGANPLQLKMSPLVRTPSLALLLGLVAGLVATATARRRPTCPGRIPPELIRDLWSRTHSLIETLPEEAKPSRPLRLLPRFCVDCHKIRDLIDVYQRRVFRREAVQRLLPLHYNDLLYRLQQTLHSCVSSSKPSEGFKLISKLDKKMKKRRGDGAALKAVREFTFILRWLDELAWDHCCRATMSSPSSSSSSSLSSSPSPLSSSSSSPLSSSLPSPP